MNIENKNPEVNIYDKENKKEEDNFEKEKGEEHEFAKEMEKPREEWSDDFKSFLNKEIEKRKLEEQQEELTEILKSAFKKEEKDWTKQEKDAYEKRKEYMEFFQEENKEGIIDMYFNDLELTEDEISSKKIIDIGCGRKAELVEHAIEKLNSKSVYGLDINLEEELLQKFPDKLHKSNFYKRLPIDDFDLIISRATIEGEDLMKEELLENILKSLNEEGELRIYPIFKNHFESDNKEVLVMEDELMKLLDRLSKEFNFNYDLKTKEISVYDKDDCPTSKNLLIIKKNIR